MTNYDIYKLVKFILRKDDKGYPEILKNFSKLLQQSSLDHFKEKYVLYQQTQGINDSLSPFEVMQSVSGLTTTATTITLPDDYAHFIGMYWTDEDGNDRVFDLVTDSEWDMRLSSTITVPSNSYPICRIRDSYLDIKPNMEDEGFATYYGVGAKGLTVAQIQELTSVVVTKANRSYDFSPSTQVYYYAYPSSYGDLVSILDDNGFETISDWTKTVRSFTTNPPYYTQSAANYNVYEFNNLTTQTNFTNTFNFT